MTQRSQDEEFILFGSKKIISTPFSHLSFFKILLYIYLFHPPFGARSTGLQSVSIRSIIEGGIKVLLNGLSICIDQLMDAGHRSGYFDC